MTRLLTIFMSFGLLVASAAYADDQAAVNTLVDQVLKAQGGAKALGKVVGVYGKIKVKYYSSHDSDGEVAFTTCEMTCQGPDKMTKVVGNDGIKTITVVNGDEGWSKVDNGPVEEIDAERLKVEREGMYINWLTTVYPLKEKEFQLSLLSETQVSDRPAIGLEVKHPKHERVRLYFDKETHLLVMLEQKSPDRPLESKKLNEVMFFTDYQAVQGVQVASKYSWFVDSALVGDAKVSETKIYDKPLDEKTFAKP